MPFIIPNQTSYVLERPTYTGTTWTRPADWITITDTTGEVQFLVSDLALNTYRINTTFTRTLGTQNIYIDWGDGVIDTISTITATDTSHTYTTGGTACSLGYNTWKIRIYGDAGTRITTAYQLVPAPFFSTPNNPSSGTLVRTSCGLLEAYYGDTTITSATFLFSYSTQRPYFYYLQYCKLPSVMSQAGNIMENAFGNCQSLYKVVMPTSAANNTSMRDTFSGCFVLQSIDLPQDMVNLTDMINTFSSCYAIQSIKLPPTLNLLTDISGAFTNCYLLKSIDFIPALPLVSSWSGTFNGCRSLITANIKQFRQTAGTITFTNAFANCFSLEYVNLPPIFPGSFLFFNNVFQNCYNLKSFIAPTNFNTTTLDNTFNGATSLSSCILPSSISACNAMANTFLNCYNLQSFTFPTTMGNNILASQTFGNCYILSEITIPNTLVFANTSTMFASCFNLRRATLPTSWSGASTSNLSSTFANCYNLQEITFPALPPYNTPASSLFSSCVSLKSFTFPTNSNYLNNFQSTFNGAVNLISIVFPTTSASSTFASCFNGATGLKTAVLPTTNFSTTFALCFNNCWSLQSVVLPSSQSTTLTTINGMFTACYALSGITNLDKLGDPSTSSTIYVDGTNAFNQTYKLTSIDMSCKFSKFTASGISTLKTALTSLRLRNNGAGQYAGTSPQIDISYTSLGQAALVQVFNDLPTVTAKTINITGATGAAALTAPERAIATGKGWTITG